MDDLTCLFWAVRTLKLMLIAYPVTNTYYVFILFRNCIGQNFAMTEMKITIATLLHNFDFSLNTSIPIELEESIILRAKNGIHLFIKPRKLQL